MAVDIKKTLKRYGLKGVNKPKRTPKHKSKSHIVLAKQGNQVKLIRFGSQGASTAPRGRKNESKADKAKRAAFRKRHARGIKRGRMSGSFWAAKVKW